MQAPGTPALPDNSIEILTALTFAAVLSAAIALIAGGLVRRLVASVEGHTHLAYPLRKAPVRLVRLGTFVVSMIALTFPALAFVDVDLPMELQGERMGQWVARTTLRIGVIVIVGADGQPAGERPHRARAARGRGGLCSDGCRAAEAGRDHRPHVQPVPLHRDLESRRC